MNVRFEALCKPAKIYFIISLISCVVAFFSRVHVKFIALKLLVAFAWTAALSWLCKKGFEDLSWLLVLLPYIIYALVFFKIIRHMNTTNWLFVPPSELK